MTGALRVVVVDDEPLAREGLRLRLAAHPGVVVVAECGSGREAVAVLGRGDADLVFLDIQMPDLDGFAVLERVMLGALPVIVFLTAHGEHALRAFRVGALDYLLKPYDNASLAATLARARRQVERIHAESATTSRPPGPGPLQRLVVREGQGIRLVATDTIDRIESRGDHVEVHAAGARYLVRARMKQLAAGLDPARFVRIHRTAIVAISAIRELRPYSRGEHVVILADGTRLPMSRRCRDQVRAALAGRP